jgi:hypothetical protein
VAERTHEPPSEPLVAQPRPLTLEQQWAEFDAGERAWREHVGSETSVRSFL